MDGCGLSQEITLTAHLSVCKQFTRLFAMIHEIIHPEREAINQADGIVLSLPKDGSDIRLLLNGLPFCSFPFLTMAGNTLIHLGINHWTGGNKTARCRERLRQLQGVITLAASGPARHQDQSAHYPRPPKSHVICQTPLKERAEKNGLFL
jgi:hypothetical protein